MFLGNYFEAIDLYSQGLEFDKNNKYIWLNRALA